MSKRMSKVKENRLVVGDEGWAKDIPDWLLKEVKTERMILGLVSIANLDIEKVGDAETLCYLFPASLRAPFRHNLHKVYLYLMTKVCEKVNKTVPIDIRVDKLSIDEERELRELKCMIYQKRGGDIHHPVLSALRQVFEKGVRQ